VTRVAKIRAGVLASVIACLPAAFVVSPHSVRALCHHLWHASLIRRAPASQSNSQPSMFFWAWERPEDLRFLSSQDVGVAFLAKTIYLSSGDTADGSPVGFTVRPRLQPLRVTASTPLIAVVRIETPFGQRRAAYNQASLPSLKPVVYPQARPNELASEIAQLYSLPSVRGIQIDFDATARERAFYSALLIELRRQLPSTFPVSITALASWCIGDPWLRQFPPGTIQEAVPMLFRMGPDAANVAHFLRSGSEFSVPACQTSLGLSTDEALSRNLLNANFAGVPSSWRQKRIYVFSPRPWTQPDAEAVLKEWQP